MIQHSLSLTIHSSTLLLTSTAFLSLSLSQHDEREERQDCDRQTAFVLVKQQAVATRLANHRVRFGPIAANCGFMDPAGGGLDKGLIGSSLVVGLGCWGWLNWVRREVNGISRSLMTLVSL